MKKQNLSKFVNGLDVVNDQEFLDIPCPLCFEFQNLYQEIDGFGTPISKVFLEHQEACMGPQVAKC
jgi:hypothetical protein